jgi:hypothetical protein
MSRAAFVRAMESMPSFRNLMSAYIHAFLEQVLVSGRATVRAQSQGAAGALAAHDA